MPYALLALASEASSDSDDIARALAAYLPWIALTMTMLDGCADVPEDAADGADCYIGYYESAEIAVRRLAMIIKRSMDEARKLQRGDRHAVIVISMVAMCLPPGHAQAREMRAPDPEALARAGGSLTRTLVPVLRIWRAAYLPREAAADRGKARVATWRRRASRMKSELPSARSCRPAHASSSGARHGAPQEMPRAIRRSLHPQDDQSLTAVHHAGRSRRHRGDACGAHQPARSRSGRRYSRAPRRRESFWLAGGSEHLHVRRAILPSFRANAVQRRAEID